MQAIIYPELPKIVRCYKYHHFAHVFVNDPSMGCGSVRKMPVGRLPPLSFFWEGVLLSALEHKSENAEGLSYKQIAINNQSEKGN